MELLRAHVGALSHIGTAKGHDEWKAGEEKSGKRQHRYKQVSFADESRREGYAMALARAGIERSKGSVLPGIVTSKGSLPEEVITKDGLTKLAANDSVIDILAIPGSKLPVERLSSEGKATNLLLADILDLGQSRGFTSFAEFDVSAIDELASKEHDRWMQFNSWVKDNQPELFVPFKELTVAEQDKDRDRVRAAIATFTDALTNLDNIARVGL